MKRPSAVRRWTDDVSDLIDRVRRQEQEMTGRPVSRVTALNELHRYISRVRDWALYDAGIESVDRRLDPDLYAWPGKKVRDAVQEFRRVVIPRVKDRG